MALELRAHLRVDADVGAPKAIDRLLRVADDEELARRRRHRAPVADRGIARREQQQDLGLQRIGVLELVDEQVREAQLKRGAHLRVIAHEIARRHQQVEEVERAVPRLRRLVAIDHLGELVAAGWPRDPRRHHA